MVIVTYGDRSHYLAEVLDAVRRLDGADHIRSIIVVNNGAAAATAQLLAATDARVVTLADNGGSAIGYATGIAAAVGEDVDYLWLLDDDNRPEEGALAALLAAAAQHPDAALQSLRPAYGRVARFAASGGRIPLYEPPDTVGAYVRRVLGRIGVPTRRTPSLEIPFATFGGFFAPRHAFRAVGLPRTDFVMYADDTEYTHRFVTAGWPIRLVPASVVLDIDRAWWRRGASAGALGPATLVRCTDDNDLARAYYTIRNSVYFESTRRVGNRLRYRLLLGIKHGVVAASAMWLSVFQRSLRPWRAYRVYLEATADGLGGRLGRRQPIAPN